MFYNIFISNWKILLYLLKLKSENLMFKVLKCIYMFESTDRFIYEHIHIDLLF